MDVKWSHDQIRVMLKAVIMRIVNQTAKYKIEVTSEKEAKFSKYENGESFYLSINPGRVYLSINSHSGFYEINGWWWKDKDIKEHVRELLNIAATDGTTAGQLLVKAFPEIISDEFEKQVLGVKDGKS